jgi:hypothetical protein
MNRIQKAAIVTRLAKKMREKGSWCGETHLQKTIFLAQELLEVPTDFDFILYKHGPFSFDLRAELTSLRADMLLEIEPQQRPFGPRFAVTSQSDKIESRFPKTLSKMEPRLDFIANKVQGKGVADLERLATALYVVKKYDTYKSVDEQAKKLHQLKPHVSIADAQNALEQISEFGKEAQSLLA